MKQRVSLWCVFAVLLPLVSPLAANDPVPVGMMDIRDFGAVGGGATINTVVVQAAVNSRVSVPPTASRSLIPVTVIVAH